MVFDLKHLQAIDLPFCTAHYTQLDYHRQQYDFSKYLGQYMSTLTCFKAYDIRGKLGTELNEEIAYKIGRAYGQIYQPKTVVMWL